MSADETPLTVPGPAGTDADVSLSPSASAGRRVFARLRPAALAASLFLLVLGAKWATFDRYGSPMPDWDQWDAEALESLVPWFTHDHFVQHLFKPHNEHRVVLTKLQGLGLVLLNGQWDSRVEAATNAALHAALALAFWLCARRWLGTGGQTRPSLLSGALFFLAAALFGLPIAWQNVLGGFHSQQYWLLALSFGTIVLVPFARTWSGTWWLGLVSGILALGSMGSGFIAAAAVMLVVAWRLFRRETTLRQAAPTFIVMAVIVAIGLLTRVEPPWHQQLKAKTVSDFVLSIVHSLQWPWRDHTWAAVVMWLPWGIVAWQVLRGDTTPLAPRAVGRGDGAVAPNSSAAQAIVALGGWVWIQLAATAYARGAGADYPASRYMDTLAFGAMVNGVAAAWLVGRSNFGDQRSETANQRGHEARRFGRRSLVSGLVALVWFVTLALGVHNLLANTVRWELASAKDYYTKAESHMRRYLALNDKKELAFPDIPFPSADGLVERLAIPSLRALMPIPIRAPLELKPKNVAPAFRENDARTADPEKPPRHGLSPGTPPLDYATTWGSFPATAADAPAIGEWRSAPITATIPGGWLKFETAGHLGNPNGGVTLELRNAATDTLLAFVRPTKLPGDTWRSAYARTPREPFVLVARDEHAARWLAFSGPVEMGALSYRVWRFMKNGLLLASLAAAASVGLGLATLVLARRPSISSGDV